MRILIALLVLCGCQSSGPSGPHHLYDGPKRPPAETATISLAYALDAPPLPKGAFLPSHANFLEANGRLTNDLDVVVLPGKQRLTIQGYHHTGAPPRLLSSLSAREQSIFRNLVKRVRFTAEPGKTYFVLPRPTRGPSLWSWYVICDKVELTDVNCSTVTGDGKLPNLRLGPDWLPVFVGGSWRGQSQCFVGLGEREMQWTKKVYVLVQTDGAVLDDFCLDTVNKETGRDFRAVLHAGGSRIFDLQIGDKHWVEKWRSAYKEGKGKWGVTVYRVHGQDLVMLAYGGPETSDPGVLDQWAKRFLEVSLPTLP